jgi:ketosteroid isomerase-like protein
MKRYLRAAVAAVLCGALFATSASNRPQQPSIKLPADLDRVLRDYERYWSARDPAALAKIFVEDGFVLSPGNPIVRGRPAIEAFYRGSGAPLALRAVAYATEGNVGYIIGAYAANPTDPDRGKFTLTLRREAGRWLIVSDMDNGNATNH